MPPPPVLTARIVLCSAVSPCLLRERLHRSVGSCTRSRGAVARGWSSVEHVAGQLLTRAAMNHPHMTPPPLPPTYQNPRPARRAAADPTPPPQVWEREGGGQRRRQRRRGGSNKVWGGGGMREGEREGAI